MENFEIRKIAPGEGSHESEARLARIQQRPGERPASSGPVVVERTPAPHKSTLADIADALPPAARRRLLDLRTASSNAHALASVASENANKARVALNRLKQAPGRDSDEARAALRRAEGDLAAAVNAQTSASDRWSNVGTLKRSVEEWMDDTTTARERITECVVKAPKIPEGEAAAMIGAAREKASKLKRQRDTVAMAPLPSADVKSACERWLDAVAEQAKPDVLGMVEDRTDVPSFPTDPSYAGTYGPIGETLQRTPSTLGLLALVNREGLLRVLHDAVDESADDKAALTPQAKAEKIESLSAAILQAERDECALIEVAAASGREYHHRAEVDPRAYLQVETSGRA
jgi:hypothetical protein